MSKTNFSCWCSSRSAPIERCTLYCVFASIYLHSNKHWRLQKRAIEFISKLNNCFSCLSCLSHAFMHIFLPLLNEIIRISSAFSLTQLDYCSTAASNKQNKKKEHTVRMTIGNHRMRLWPLATTTAAKQSRLHRQQKWMRDIKMKWEGKKIKQNEEGKNITNNKTREEIVNLNKLEKVSTLFIPHGVHCTRRSFNKCEWSREAHAFTLRYYLCQRTNICRCKKCVNWRSSLSQRCQ